MRQPTGSYDALVDHPADGFESEPATDSRGSDARPEPHRRFIESRARQTPSESPVRKHQRCIGAYGQL